MSSVNVELKPIEVKTKPPVASDATVKIEYTTVDANGIVRTHFMYKMIRVPTGNPEKGAAKAIRAAITNFPNKTSIKKIIMVNFSGVDRNKAPDIDLTEQPKINKTRTVPGKNNAQKTKGDE